MMYRRKSSKKLIATLSLILLLGLLGAYGPGESGLSPAVRAEGDNRAGLVVRFSDDDIVIRQITFSENSISSYELLTRSDLEVEAAVSGMGAAVCRIEDVGCPSSNCFCQSPPDSWAYYHLQDGEWVYSPVGASAHQVEDGDVDGWSWGNAEPPPAMSKSDVLEEAAATPSPTDSSTATSTPSSTASATARPSDTPQPSNTPTATRTPVPPEDDTAQTTSDSYPEVTQEPAPTSDGSSSSAYPDQTSTPTEVATAPTVGQPTATRTPRTSRTPGATHTPESTASPTRTPRQQSATPVATVTRAPIKTEGPGETEATQSAATPTEGASPATEATPTAPAEMAGEKRTVSDDEIAALIATSVAADQAAQEASVSGTVKKEGRGYSAFFAIVAILLVLTLYVFLLRRQRRRDALALSDDEEANG